MQIFSPLRLILNRKVKLHSNVVMNQGVTHAGQQKAVL